MKNLIIFIFGVMVGASGSIIYLRKEIKKEMECRSNDVVAQGKIDDVPFVAKEDSDASNADDAAQAHFDAVKAPEKVAYNKIINDIENGVKPMNNVFITPREDEPDASYIEHGDDISIIDKSTYVNDKTYEKELLVYYQGDKIVSTEDGTVITNPAMLIGTEWEHSVGVYAPNTAFVRNNKLVMDYEIYVEDGLYTDEHGPFDIRED